MKDLQDLVLVAAVFLWTTGCQSAKEVTTADIVVLVGTNKVFTIKQPKDTMFDRAEARMADGSSFVIEGYQSTANAAAISAVEAANRAQAEVAKYGMDLVREAAEKAAASQGVPARSATNRLQRALEK